MFSALERTRGVRLFVHRVGPATAQPISPEDIIGPAAVAPDGQQVVGINTRDRSTWLFPLDSSWQPRSVPQVTPDEIPIQWSEDGSALYLRHRGGEMPLRVFRLDLPTGEKSLWREVGIPDRAGVLVISNMLLTPDGRNQVIVYTRTLSELFLLTGVS